MKITCNFKYHPMKNTKVKLVIFILLFVSSVSLKAQESINSSGTSFSSSEGEISYSIGQLMYTSYTNNTGSINQGIQRAFEDTTLSNQNFSLDTHFSVYPNPINGNHFTIVLTNLSTKKLSFALFDVHGRLLKNGKIVENETKINMTNFSTAIYFVSIINSENRKLETFKIIKL